jgi:hypothetical protein
MVPFISCMIALDSWQGLVGFFFVSFYFYFYLLNIFIIIILYLFFL